MTHTNKTHTPKPTDCLRLAAPPQPVDGRAWRSAMDTLHEWARRSSATIGLGGADIENAGFHAAPPDVNAARDLLCAALHAQMPSAIRERLEEHHLEQPELLYCRWAAPHTDNMFDKELFLSLVVGTGPSPYRVESLVPVFTRHLDGRRTPRFGFERHSMDLSQGALFLLDPLVPHYACPNEPHQDSLLSILQFRIPYGDQRERARWIRQLAPERVQTATPSSAGGLVF